jgi:hypothetical protein
MVKGTHLTATALAFVLVAGCRSADVNPPAPRAANGYVDFYTDSNQDLSWEVKWERDQAGKMKKAFSQFEPVESNILRLATPAGTHRFQVWFINEVTTGPQHVIVQVANGRITPVHVTLTPAGSASIDNKSYEYRSTARATRRVTRIATQEQQVFQIGAVAASPQDYQPKQRTPYFSPESK